MSKNPAAVALGRLGGQARREKRGLQAADPETKQKVALAGVEARKKARKLLGNKGK